jgi:hypothetical protein
MKVINKILISHRGNLDGPNPNLENSPGYLEDALQLGFDVEIDVWFKEDLWFLGHDSPEYPTTFEFLSVNKDRLWIHAKNIQAAEKLSTTKLNWFWHENDVMTLTSWGFIWAYPGKQPIRNSIAVLPETHGDPLENTLGICSDFISYYLR